MWLVKSGHSQRMNILDEILVYKKNLVAEQKADLNMSLESLEKSCLDMPATKSFIAAIKEKQQQNKIALIAEVKKASPSKGIIREDFNPVDIALTYEENEASAISILTDEKYFKGSIEYFKAIRKAVDLPLLRKDFIVDTFQIYQSRLMGADMILLIVSALTKEQLKEYYQLAKSIGLEVLVETHDAEEFNTALELGAKLIGINNRNLKTFEVSLMNTINIIQNKQITDKYIISESGINTPDDISLLKNNNVSGVLVGESLMRQDNIGVAVQKLMS